MGFMKSGEYYSEFDLRALSIPGFWKGEYNKIDTRKEALEIGESVCMNPPFLLKLLGFNSGLLLRRTNNHTYDKKDYFAYAKA
jgi:hypothetical protein